MSNDYLNEQNIRRFFNDNKSDNYSKTSQLFKKFFKNRSSSVFTERHTLSDKFHQQRFDSPENLGLCTHFIDVNIDKTDYCLPPWKDKAGKRLTMNHYITKTKNKVYYVKKNVPKKIDEYKVKRIKDIQASSRRNNASDPGWYKPNYSAIYKRSIYPYIGKAITTRDPTAIIEDNEKDNNNDDDNDKNKENNDKENEEDYEKKNHVIEITKPFPKKAIKKDKKNNSSFLTRNNKNGGFKGMTIKSKIPMNNIMKKIQAVILNQAHENNNNNNNNNNDKDIKSKTIRDKILNKTIVKLPISPKDLFLNNTMMTSTINFKKMVGRNDRLQYNFKHKLIPFVSYTPNFAYLSSKIKTTLFSKVKSLNDIKRHQISKLLHSNIAENNEYSVITFNRTHSSMKHKKFKRSSSNFLEKYQEVYMNPYN